MATTETGIWIPTDQIKDQGIYKFGSQDQPEIAGERPRFESQLPDWLIAEHKRTIRYVWDSPLKLPSTIWAKENGTITLDRDSYDVYFGTNLVGDGREERAEFLSVIKDSRTSLDIVLEDSYGLEGSMRWWGEASLEGGVPQGLVKESVDYVNSVIATRRIPLLFRQQLTQNK